MSILLIVGVVLVGLVVMRRRRRTTLAGLNADKPSFVLTPPTRWSTSGRDHRL